MARAANAPYLSWTPASNPVLGRLKLQSMERSNIFYEEWVHLVLYNGGIDNRGSMFPVNPYSLNQSYYPKKVEAPLETTVVKGLYQDSIGDRLKKDIAYTVKVFVWVETEEDADGIEFDFQKDNENNLSEEKNG